MIYPVPAFTDNYIWILLSNDSSCAWAVDPGDAAPVMHFLEQRDLTLEGILITHHHRDHIGGVKDLHDKYHCHVVGPTHLTDVVTQSVKDGESINIFEYSFEVIATPGHTLDHLCYYAEDWQGEKVLFSGDTLFRGGCGRLFEGTAEQMYESLQKLANLPKETDIYCAHEYTIANYRFALALEPSNQTLQNLYTEAQKSREDSHPTIPTKLYIEQQTNPFLRTRIDEISTNSAAYLNLKNVQNPIERFAQIRKVKDIF